MRERAQKRSGDPNPFESDRTRIKQKTGHIVLSLFYITCERGFEPPTPWSVAKCSIQLSYSHILNFFNKKVPATGIEPVRVSLPTGF